MMPEAHAHTLHCIFNGANPKKISETLKHTRGLKAVELPAVNCKTCQVVKQHKHGESHKKHGDREMINMFQDIMNESSSSSDTETDEESESDAAVAAANPDSPDDRSTASVSDGHGSSHDENIKKESTNGDINFHRIGLHISRSKT